MAQLQHSRHATNMQPTKLQKQQLLDAHLHGGCMALSQIVLAQAVWLVRLPSNNTEVQVLKAQVPTRCNRRPDSCCIMQLCAPREVVLQQMWREEEDGTFIVLLHSTKHRKASMPAPSWSWWQPIRAQVGPAPCPVLSCSSTLLSFLPLKLKNPCLPVGSLLSPFATLLPPNFVPPVYLPSGLQPFCPSVTLILLKSSSS